MCPATTFRFAGSDRLPPAIGALAGALGGFVVGLADGARAAWLFGAGARATVGAMLLAAAVDALVGLVGGGLVELVARLSRWGRRGAAPWPARAGAFALAGSVAAVFAAEVVTATSLRNNRFLAAGLAALAGAGVAVVASLFVPTLARAASFRSAVPRDPPAVGPAMLLLAPIAAAAAGGAIFLSLWRTRAPLRGPALTTHLVLAALPALVLPWLLARAARWRARVRWRTAALVAGGVYGGTAVLGLALSWSDNLRFAPWTDILVGASIAVASLVVLVMLTALGPRLPRRHGAAAALAGAALFLALALTLAVSESEAARQATSLRGGLVGPVLAIGRRLFDRDGDGYARFFGGGDCDDQDPAVHPEALDLPGDGLDSDCDGQDAVSVLPPPAEMAPLPTAVPRDLNLLFLTIDTVRADHLGCYGYGRATSPEIDRLAAAGTLFENGWAHAPSTRYSMPALATGRWPSAIEWDESIWWPRLGPRVRTLAQALHDRGYFTGGLFSFSYFALGDHRGFERGMDVYNADRAILHVAVNGPVESRGSSSREMADDAIAFIEAHQDRKFFLWLHFYDPHLSYERHPEVPSFGSSRLDLYDGEIRFTDLHVGRVLARLKALGLWDRTAVVLTGDHGEGFGEHGVTEHGFDLYAPQTKVPLIVRVPGLPPQRLQTPAAHVDLGPTMLNLAGGPAEPTFIGRSLVRDLAGTPPAVPLPIFQEVSSERGKKRALVTADRHVIWSWVPGNTTECYDVARDPGEAHNLWGGGGDAACTRLKAELQRMVSGLALPAGAAAKMAQGVAPPGAPPFRPSNKLEAMIGDQIEVRGYDLAPAIVHPGGEVAVTYYFVSKKPIADRWRLFFHLETPAGYRNADHIPVEGLMPLDHWRPGQQIRDAQRIAVPLGSPPGVYTIYVGVFRGITRQPVTPPGLTDGKDRLRLASFVVR